MVYQNVKSDYIYVVNKVMAGVFNLFSQKHLWRNWWSQSRDIGQIILPISARPPGNHVSHLDRNVLLFETLYICNFGIGAISKRTNKKVLKQK